MHWICCLDYYIRITPISRRFIFTSDSIIIYLQPSACNQNVPIFCTIYTNGFLFICNLLNQDYLIILYRLSNGFSIFVILCVFDHICCFICCATDLNYRHRNAQMASRASVELHTLIFFKSRYEALSLPLPPPLGLSLSLSHIAFFSCRPTDTEARVVRIRSNGFFVFVPKYVF